jgi:hypothetical protein
LHVIFSVSYLHICARSRGAKNGSLSGVRSPMNVWRSTSVKL